MTNSLDKGHTLVSFRVVGKQVLL